MCTANTRFLSSTAIVFCALTWSTVSHAQVEGAASSLPPEQAQAASDIIVTGSRIKRPNDASASPIVTTSLAELKSGAGQTLGDLLANLPSLRTTTTFTNDNINVLDLRGLGANRTLVLVNGKRQVGALEGEASVDVETIPLALLQRVDIVTGGASAVYGSDAVSGVVNFITRTDFEGLAIAGQGGAGTDGGAGSFAGSVTAGKNFADKRGNIAISFEYGRREKLRNSDRSYARDFELFNPNPNKQSDDDGLPFNILYRDFRLPLISDGGTILGSDLLQFRPDGSVGAIDPGDPAFFTAAGNAANGGSGLALNRYSLIQPTSDRISANLLFNFEFSPAFKVFAEGKFVRSKIANSTQPTVQVTTVSKDNAFLSQASRDAIALVTDPADPTFLLLNANSGLGLISSDIQRDLYRGVIGLKGDLGSDLSYEVSYIHGETAALSKLGNSRVTARFANALDSVVDGAGVLGTPGAIVCRSTLTAGRRNTGNFDVDQCQPVNIFGEGNISAAARNYINATLGTRLRLKQDIVSAFISGTTSAFFALPGGPVGFAIGGEYRRESSQFTVPNNLNSVPGDSTGINLYTQGLTFRREATPSRGSLEVKELFGEISLPILKGVPLAEELTLDAAYRYADYNIRQVAGVSTWKLGVQYRPIRDVRLRATYAQAVRAPNINELFGPSRADSSNIADPCDATRLNSGSSTRAANCAALGLPSTLDVLTQDNFQIFGLASGNQNLQAETSRSLTVGGVLTPQFIPGLSLSVDYYRIRIRNAISLLSAQQAANLCVDSSSIDNEFCGLITRATVDNGITPQGAITSYLSRAQNFSSLEAEGIDFQGNYATNLGNSARLALRAVGTYVIKRNDFPFIEDPEFVDQILLEVGDPQWNVNFGADLSIGKLKLGYGLRFIGSQFLTNVENVRSVGGRPPQQPNVQDILKTRSVFYHDARIGYQVRENGEFFFAVSNLLNTRPPVGLVQSTSLTIGGSLYDSIGRYFNIGFSLKF